jgi:hypothetical protein
MFEQKTSHKDSNMFKNLDSDLIVSHLKTPLPNPPQSPSQKKYTLETIDCSFVVVDNS